MKTYRTSKNKEHIINKLESLKCTPDLFVRAVNSNRLRVGTGRIQTYWDINFDNTGEISVKRHRTVLDNIALAFIIILDLIISFLSLYNRVDFRGILITTVLEQVSLFLDTSYTI